MYKLKQENTKVEIELTIDGKEWEEGVQRVYETSKSKFNVTGFRKGHAPRKVIEKEYGDSVFFEDTVELFFNKTLGEVLRENPNLEPVAMPTTQFESFTVEKGLKMKIFYDVVPNFELCKYKGVSIPVHTAEVTDHDIKHEIKHLLEEHATFETVDRPIKNGDSALINFTGYMDGVEFEGGKAENYPLEIGSHSFIDTFEDQLVGHKAGDNVDVNVTFPENYGASEFSGKKALFKVVVNEVREKHLPTLDDKFISNATEFETVEEYRKDLTAHIQTMKTNEQDSEFEYNMRNYLLDNTKIEIPEVMIENSVNHDINRLKEALAPYGMTPEDYLKQTGGGTLEDYANRIRENSVRAIKSRYIYRKLIDENKLDVSEKELAKATKGLTNEDDILRVENEMLLKNLFKFLKENNKLEILPEEECGCCDC